VTFLAKLSVILTQLAVLTAAWNQTPVVQPTTNHFTDGVILAIG